jgi:hypothetical protein
MSSHQIHGLAGHKAGAAVVFHQFLNVEMGAKVRLYFAWPHRAAAQQLVAFHVLDGVMAR